MGLTRHTTPTPLTPLIECLSRRYVNQISGQQGTLLRFSRPPMTLSVAASKSTMLTSSLPERAAMRAASLHTFAMSAPT